MQLSKKALFQKAHWNANWKKLSNDKRPYREIFAEQLRLAWSQAKRAEEAKRSFAVREQLRDEQNIGLPIRSTPIDYRRTYYTRQTRFASAFGE